MLIELEPRDGEKVVVEYECLKICGFIVAAVDVGVEDMENNSEDEGECETKASELIHIPVPQVSRETLDSVIAFCRMYHEKPMTPIPKPMPWPKRVYDLVDHDYARFVYTRSYDALDLIIQAANYLDNDPLLELCGARYARNMVNGTPEQIRERFGIQEEFTPEEYDMVLTNTKWTTEKTAQEDMPAEPRELIQSVLGVDLVI